jgi:glucose-6-phosphate dehydrogenase assembly protein OpcA
VPRDVAAAPGTPTLRWEARATSVAEIERELSRIWSSTAGMAARADGAEGRLAARTSVLNLVVVASSREVGERSAATLAMSTGRHPSRTLVLVSGDPDGPSWLSAEIRAYCMVPRSDAPETCAEQVYITLGGEAGRRLPAIVAPLLVHDLPVTVWWPGNPPLASPVARSLIALADRLVVDGSRWGGDGLARLVAFSALAGPGLALSDFAFMRQARWREALASTFDRPGLLPYLRSVRQVSVTYSTRGGAEAEATTNLVKPIYQVAWLASRLGLRVVRPLERETNPGTGDRAMATGTTPAGGRVLRAELAGGRGAEIEVLVRPVASSLPAGTTIRLEVAAERRDSELWAEVTARAESVRVRAWENGLELLDRTLGAARRTDADLLAEAIETGGRDPIFESTLAMAVRLTGGQAAGGGSSEP